MGSGLTLTSVTCGSCLDTATAAAMIQDKQGTRKPGGLRSRRWGRYGVRFFESGRESIWFAR